MDREEVLQFVAQEDVRGLAFRTQFGAEWVTVEASIKRASEDVGIGAALLPAREVERALRKADWDQLQGSFAPGHVTHYAPGREEVTTYHRLGDDDGIEPLIVHRSFHGVRPNSMELCEEFRLFHNLFFESARSEFVRFADNGDEEVVVRMKGDRVEVRRDELLQYVSAKEMVLVLCIDRFRYGMIEPVLQPSEALVEDVTESDMVYAFHRSDARHVGYKDRNVLSRLLGKLLVRGDRGRGTRVGDEERFEDFIIDVDEAGQEVRHTSNPEMLSNYFGANPGAPHYLTPVFFRREVLQKYYADSSRYEVADSYLKCARLWGLRMDNNHDRYVIVWLGDLGRDLPAGERLYWKSFNVRPDGKISTTYYRRAILGEFAEAVAEDHAFKDQYRQTNARWEEILGWPIFKPLAAGDEHVVAVLRIPLSNSPSEFDDQVMALTKLMVDSLNERELVRGLSGVPGNAKGIAKLEAFLKAHDSKGAATITEFMRGIQALRSTGVAHRKGGNYESAKKRFGVGVAPHPAVFRSILKEAIETLQLLEVAALVGDA
ncbi:MAG TPA: hypothetical protein VL332_02060 [Candidatus Saccharimonadaceae bacterium]|jgi:hypothetical protein|nr:hypothetical protein [Candidatus Saccharimonadaceae bacterium]